MKMRVKAVTNNWRGEELTAIRQAHATAGLGLLSYEAETAVEHFRQGRGKIVHLECGHEFRIDLDDSSPSQFDCRYCSHVPTIEEQREARIAHQAETERQLL